MSPFLRESPDDGARGNHSQRRKTLAIKRRHTNTFGKAPLCHRGCNGNQEPRTSKERQKDGYGYDTNIEIEGEGGIY